MFGMGPWELLIILAIVLLIFGPRRLKTLGSDLGNAIKGFRSAVTEREAEAGPDEKVIESEAATGTAGTTQKAEEHRTS